MKRVNSVVALLLALVMLLTACSGTAGSDNHQNSGTPASESEQGATRDTIHLALNQVVETLNPFASANIVDMQLFCQLYETLFFVTDTGELEPRIAESYEAHPDGMTYTVHLRNDVKFHNGETLTAEDVAWSLDYAMKSGPYTQKRTNLSSFESATAVDENTVEIKSSTTSANFFTSICLFGYILQKDAFLAAEADETVGSEWIPFGTGPYMVAEYNPDAEIKLVAFPEYYRGKARIDKIDYQILADSNTITVAFEAGDLDLIVVPTATWASISANTNYQTYLSPTNHTSFFHINIHNNDALSNKLVRQALSYAIDRESMCIAAYDGVAQPAYSMFNADTVVGGFTVEELEAAGIPTYAYNPEKAKELLAEAGYGDGLDIGKILTINGSYWEKMSTIFQSNLADIGVTVGVELADSASCRASRKDHDYNLATTGTNYSPDASYCYQYFRYLTDEQRAEGIYSELDVENKDLDDLLQKAMNEQDPNVREDTWLEINRVLQDEMYSIPTFYKSIPYAYQKGLVCEEINTNYYYVYNFYWE